MAIQWEITQLERDPETNGVTAAYWRASVTEVTGSGSTEQTHSAECSGSVSFIPDTLSEDFIEYSELGEDDVIAWVQARLDVGQYYSLLARRITESKAPAVLEGIPW